MSKHECDKIYLHMLSFALDIGLDVTKSLPIGTRIVDGLFQGLAVRASGFAIVPIANLAPAIQCVQFFACPLFTTIHEPLDSCML